MSRISSNNSSIDHYENFPVASILLPAHLRPAVQAIYAFARSADDLADEGDATAQQRLAALQQYEQALQWIENGASSERNQSSEMIEIAATPLFNRLARVVREKRLPLQPMRDLLSAFKQDVVTTRYADFDALLDYCRRSANPVGVLMLHLYGAVDERNLRESDAICSALQLINFLQDVAIDWRKGRIYLPQQDLARFAITEADIAAEVSGPSWNALMQFETARARALLLSGAPLALRLPGRIGYELRLVVQGGLRILEKIEAAEYDIFRRRPQLHAGDWLRLGWRALRMRAL